jgi:hypothetical protein
MAKKSKESPYYHWTNKLPTHEGLWYRRDRITHIGARQFIVQILKPKDPDCVNLICYLDEDGWHNVENDTPGYFEWSSKPVPFPETKEF